MRWDDQQLNCGSWYSKVRGSTYIYTDYTRYPLYILISLWVVSQGQPHLN